MSDLVKRWQEYRDEVIGHGVMASQADDFADDLADEVEQLEAEKAATVLSTTRVLKQNEEMRAKWDNFQAIEIDGKGYYIEPAAYRHIEQLEADLKLSKTMYISLCTEKSYWKNKYADMVAQPQLEKDDE